MSVVDKIAKRLIRSPILETGDPVDSCSAHITALAGIPEFHKDPFDRMLIAQAAAEGLTLVTNDVQIQRYSIKTLW